MGIAIAGSAFTYAQKTTIKTLAPIVYYQSTTGGTYVKVQPTGSCTESDNPCTIEYPNPSNQPGPNSFTLGVNEPTNLGSPQPSEATGYYH